MTVLGLVLDRGAHGRGEGRQLRQHSGVVEIALPVILEDGPDFAGVGDEDLMSQPLEESAPDPVLPSQLFVP